MIRNSPLGLLITAGLAFQTPETAVAQDTNRTVEDTTIHENDSAGSEEIQAPKISVVSPWTDEPAKIPVSGEMIVLETSPDYERAHFMLTKLPRAWKEFCIPAGEYLIFEDSAGVHEIAGPDCLLPGSQELDENAKQIEKVGPVIIRSSGPQAYKFAVGTRLERGSTITLVEGDAITIVDIYGRSKFKGPGTYRAVYRGGSPRAVFANLTREGARQRVRPGATRAGAGSRKKFGEVVIWQGTPSAVDRYPLKTVIAAEKEICLKEGETLTLLHKIGGRVVIVGPGCNRFLDSGAQVNMAGVTGG